MGTIEGTVAFGDGARWLSSEAAPGDDQRDALGTSHGRTLARLAGALRPLEHRLYKILSVVEGRPLDENLRTTGVDTRRGGLHD